MLQRVPGDVLADVPPEQVAYALVLAQAGGHVVEPGLQAARLARVVHRHRGLQVTALDPGQPLAYRTHGVGDGARGDVGDLEPDQQRHPAEHEHRDARAGSATSR